MSCSLPPSHVQSVSPLCWCRRFFKCCCACCCGWCKPSKNPGMFIRGRGMLASRVVVMLMAAGTVAACIYGMTKVGTHLVAQGLSVVDNVKVGAPACGL